MTWFAEAPKRASESRRDLLATAVARRPCRAAPSSGSRARRDDRPIRRVAEASRAEIERHPVDGAAMLDPFSGRGMIPLEAARLGLPASSRIDYSPVAVLASRLLADYPFRDWSGEPPLPFAVELRGADRRPTATVSGRPSVFVDEVGRRHRRARWRRSIPPSTAGSRGATSGRSRFPCQECGRTLPADRLPMTFASRAPRRRAKACRSSTKVSLTPSRPTEARALWSMSVHDGPPVAHADADRFLRERAATTVPGSSRSAPFCGFGHDRSTLIGAPRERARGADAVLLAADHRRKRREALSRARLTPRSRSGRRRGAGPGVTSRASTRCSPLARTRRSPRATRGQSSSHRLRRPDVRRPDERSPDARRSSDSREPSVISATEVRDAGAQ